MNEQIKELAFKANKDLDGNVPIGFAEKFAELIVKECMAQCADNGSNDEWDKGVRWAVAQIKEHFGVE